MKHVSRQAVPAFAEIELLQRSSPTRLIVDEIQCVNGLIDATDLGNSLRQTSRPVIDLQGAHNAHGRHELELERAEQAQHVIPVWHDSIEVNALPRPVFITDRGKPAHVLLSIEEYQRITGGHQKIADLLAMPGPERFELEIPHQRDLPQPADFS